MSTIIHPRTVAEYWHTLPDGRIECVLCPHHCHIPEGGLGRCKVRRVEECRLIALGYGILSSVHVDPVEKKPLYHFHPGASIFSVGGWGCNFSCPFCQNWSISQDFRQAGTYWSPERIVEAMKAEGCSLIAYTYNEPLIGFEFVRDCCKRVRAAGGKNVLVTNGYCEEGPAAELLPLVNALNVDIKSMDAEFYQSQCKGWLEPVLRFCKQAAMAGCHLEITNLIIPGLNDSDDGLNRLARWIRDELGPLTPLHLSAYHPDYRLDLPPTPGATLLRAYDLCREFLSYVYLGNLPMRQGRDMVCPECGTVLIGRSGYSVRITGLDSGRCSKCGRKADVIS